MKNRKSSKVVKKELIEEEYDENEDEKDDGYDSKGVELIRNEEVPSKKKEPITLKKVMIRTIAALFMCAFYLLILKAGHFYCIMLGVLTQFELYRELVNVRYVEAKLRTMPLFRTLQWSWFLVAMFAVYSETIHKFCLETQPLNHLTKITENFSKCVFPLYCSIFVASVLTLQKGLLKFQLSQYMWSIVTTLLVVFQTKFFARNTLNGLFWFFFPMATVVMNDVSAFFCGITMGRKFIKAPFIAMSPNKTWEGFLGAGVLTMIFSFYWPLLLSQWTWFTCPAENIYISAFPPPLSCEVNSVFIEQMVNIPYIGQTLIRPIQLHGLAYGLFASLVAPFGGFFASAIKRAYNKKDFDAFLPGHGGLMDRMDCQLMILAFTSFHYSTFIAPAPTVSKILSLITLLSFEEQKALLIELNKLIAAST